MFAASLHSSVAAVSIDQYVCGHASSFWFTILVRHRPLTVGLFTELADVLYARLPAYLIVYLLTATSTLDWLERPIQAPVRNSCTYRQSFFFHHMVYGRHIGLYRFFSVDPCDIRWPQSGDLDGGTRSRGPIFLADDRISARTVWSDQIRTLTHMRTDMLTSQGDGRRGPALSFLTLCLRPRRLT